MLSNEFMAAQWRETTNTDGKAIGISFDLADDWAYLRATRCEEKEAA